MTGIRTNRTNRHERRYDAMCMAVQQKTELLPGSFMPTVRKRSTVRFALTARNTPSPSEDSSVNWLFLVSTMLTGTAAPKLTRCISLIRWRRVGRIKTKVVCRRPTAAWSSTHGIQLTGARRLITRSFRETNKVVTMSVQFKKTAIAESLANGLLLAVSHGQ